MISSEFLAFDKDAIILKIVKNNPFFLFCFFKLFKIRTKAKFYV